MIALSLVEMTPGVDVGQVLAMSLIHDLAESRTTDLHHLAQRYVEVDEARAVADQTEGLPFAEALRGHYSNYRDGSSVESKVVKDADQIELLLSLRERDRDDRTGEVKGWIERLLERLQTEAGRALAQSILRSDVDRWWTRGGGASC